VAVPGRPPPPDRFAADLWSQVLVQYVVRTHSDEPVGQVVAYAADLAAGHASWVRSSNPTTP
jgi:hypothetical protein